MSLTLADLIGDVRDLIGLGAYDRLFSQEMTVKGLNFACTQCAEIMDLTRVDVRLTVTANQAAQPADAVKLVSLQTWWTNSGGKTMGKNLYESTMESEDQKNPNWRSRAGEPTVWIPYSGNTILLNGQPGTGYVQVGYIQEPTPMVNLTDSPDSRIKDFLHQFFRFAAASWLTKQVGQGQNLKKSREYYADFIAGIKDTASDGDDD